MDYQACRVKIADEMTFRDYHEEEIYCDNCRDEIVKSEGCLCKYCKEDEE